MILNTSIWKQTVTAAKNKAAQHPAWLRAIDRAVVEIEKARYWAFADGVLTIQSTTSNKLYKVGESHTCEAKGGVCKHRAAQRLMELYFAALQSDAGGQINARPRPRAMTQRQAERERAILVKPQPKATKYGCFDI